MLPVSCNLLNCLFLTGRFVSDVRPLVEGATEAKQRELAKLIHAIYRPYVARLVIHAICRPHVARYDKKY